MIDGIDVSAQQGNVDWGLVPGILGIAKATEGNYYQDAELHGNLSGLVNANKRPGVYHFIRAGINWASQAQYFLSFVRAGINWAQEKPIILALDLEPYPGEPWPMGPDETVANTMLFLETVQNATGVIPWLYTYPSFMSMLLNSPHAHDLAAYPLWWADPSGINPAPWDPALIQTGQGTVPGVSSGEVDLNSLGPAYDKTLPTPTPEEDVLEYWYNPDVAPNPEVWVTDRLTKRKVGDSEWKLLNLFPPAGGVKVTNVPKDMWDSVPDVNAKDSGSGSVGGTVTFQGTGTIA